MKQAMGLKSVLHFVKVGVQRGNYSAAVGLLDDVIAQVDGVAARHKAEVENGNARAAGWELLARVYELKAAGAWDLFRERNEDLIEDVVRRLES